MILLLLIYSITPGCDLAKDYDGEGYFLPHGDPQEKEIASLVHPEIYEDVQWETDNSEDNYYAPLKIESNDVKKRIAQYKKLDGRELSFGRRFKARSTLLLSLYSQLIYALDRENKCSEANEYVPIIEELYNDKNILTISIEFFPAGLVFIYPDMDAYGKEPVDYDEYLQRLADPPLEGKENCKDVERKLDMIIYGREINETELDTNDWEDENDY